MSRSVSLMNISHKEPGRLYQWCERWKGGENRGCTGEVWGKSWVCRYSPRLDIYTRASRVPIINLLKSLDHGDLSRPFWPQSAPLDSLFYHLVIPPHGVLLDTIITPFKNIKFGPSLFTLYNCIYPSSYCNNLSLLPQCKV